MAKPELILGRADEDGSQLALNPSLQYSLAGVLLAGAIGAAAGWGAQHWFSRKFKEAEEAGKAGVNPEEFNRLVALLEADKALDDETLALLKSLDLSQLAGRLDALSGALSSNKSLLDSIVASFNGHGSADSQGIDDIKKGLSVIKQLIEGMVSNGTVNFDPASLQSSINGLKTSIEGSIDSLATDLNGKLDRVSPALESIIDKLRVDTQTIFDGIEALKEGQPSGGTSGISENDINRIYELIESAGTKVTLAKIFEKLTSSVSLTSADAAVPWYNLLTDEEKRNLGKLLEDQNDGVSLHGLTADDIESALKGISNGRTFPFTVPVLETDGLTADSKLRYNGSTLDVLYITNAVAALALSGSDTNISPSVSSKLGQPNGRNVRFESIELYKDGHTPGGRPGLYLASTGRITSLDDNALLGIPARLKLLSVVNEFMDESVDDLIEALNNANDGNLAAGFIYAVMMSQFGIAQSANEGARNAWNDFNTAVKAGKLTERFTKRDLTNLLSSKKLNTLLYIIWSTRRYVFKLKTVN